ncbi:hypothetical protein PR048_017013, partial [Dryococelus australis]
MYLEILDTIIMELNIRLKFELSATFTYQHFPAKTVQEMQCFLYQNEIQSGLPEVYKLCELVFAIPATSTQSSVCTLHHVHIIGSVGTNEVRNSFFDEVT